MRNLLTICAFIASVVFAIGCKEDPTSDPTLKPTPSEKPELTLTAGEVAANTFTFEASTTIAGELGYAVVAEGYQTPTFNELFAENSVEINDNVTVTIEELNGNTNYTLYAILRSGEDGTLSDPKTLKFTTLDGGDEGPIKILNIGYDNASFSIDIPGNILFQCIDEAYLNYENISVEEYFSTLGIAIPVVGPLTVDWVNGNMYGDIEMRMREDSYYYVIAASCDDAAPYPNITGKIHYKKFKTKRKPVSSAGVTTQLETASTSVSITTDPDSTVQRYCVYVDLASQLHMIRDDYGEALLISSVLKQVDTYGNGWSLTEYNEGTWSGLLPETEYSIALYVEDINGGTAITLIDFTTEAKSLGEPEVEMSVTEHPDRPHNTLILNLLCYDAASAKVVFRPTADVMDKRKELTDEQIVNSYGTEVGQLDIEAMANSGVSIIMEDLWPEVEYTVIVSVKNVEQTETILTTTSTTPKQAAAPRVESELFTSLLGTWEMTYSLIQENGVEATVTDTVTIAQGVDEKSTNDYRDQNQLVILGFPFNVSAQGAYSPIPYYSPEDLLNELSNYYSHGMNLVYRDYGPKLFLQIGEGDVITMPSSKGCYLYNWATEGFFNFYGCDYDNKRTAPATFPVTLSEDGNTLTIGACHSGEEFSYGIYRPSVFLNDYHIKACATSDIVLKRVK